MTSKDVRQYLEKLYNVPVMHVRTKMIYNDRKYRPSLLSPNDAFFR